MPWTTPTLKQVRGLTRDYVLSQLGAVAMIPNSVLRIMSDAMSALAHLTMLYIDWLSKQMLPDTAEADWLDRHGTIWLSNADGSRGRKAAAFASGSVTVTGTDGTPIPNGTIFLFAGTINYQSTALVTLGASGDVVVPLVCLTPGVVGNLSAGEIMTLAVAGADGTATVIGTTGGTEIESDDDLRERVLFRIQQPPMGGDAADYELWARSVAGVTRAWCAPLEMGIGTVTVRFMMDDLRADNGGFPLPDDVAAVKAYLDTKRPVAIKDMFVVAPLPMPIDLTISELDQDNENVRANIEDAMVAMLRQRAAPSHSLNGIRQPAQTIFEAWASDAISGVSGVNEFHLEMGDKVPTYPGNLAVLGTIFYELG